MNIKGPDYTAHAYGPDSAEIRETLGELDRQIARAIEALERKAGARDKVRLRTLGYSLQDVAAFLESLPYIQVAFTEDEVRGTRIRH